MSKATNPGMKNHSMPSREMTLTDYRIDRGFIRLQSRIGTNVLTKDRLNYFHLVVFHRN
jgi:hypothetical protein